MPDILDISPAVREVETHVFGKVKVTGLSIGGIVNLIKAHPQLLKMFNEEDKRGMQLEEIMSLGEEVVASFLAAGLGHPGKEEVIAKCKMINPEDALKLGEAILEESFPGGAANFFKRIAKAADLINDQRALKEPIPLTENNQKVQAS